MEIIVTREREVTAQEAYDALDYLDSRQQFHSDYGGMSLAVLRVFVRQSSQGQSSEHVHAADEDIWERIKAAAPEGEWRQTPIAKLNIPTVGKNGLVKDGVRTVADALERRWRGTRDSLCAAPNVGRKSLRDLCREIERISPSPPINNLSKEKL